MKFGVVLKMKIAILLMILANISIASPIFAETKSNSQNQTIQGSSGGSIDSKNCGFISSSPSYTLSLSQRMDYMRMFLQTNGGQPTLLVIGPKAEDSFCVLGDMGAGLNPEISGVWEPGTYKIYVGDRVGESHQFTLKISTDKN